MRGVARGSSEGVWQRKYTVCLYVIVRIKCEVLFTLLTRS